MYLQDGKRLYSASDLVNFLGCAHATFLDLSHLAAPAEFPQDDDYAQLLQEKGIEHERRYLDTLRSQRASVVEIPVEGVLGLRVERTRAAMRDGADVIYQGALLSEPWHGYSDFLLRVEGVPSRLGDFAYEVADTKLSRSAKPKHILQLCVYADLLAIEQGAVPPRLHVVLGDGSEVALRTSAVKHYFSIARTRFETFGAQPPGSSLAEPCGHCMFCRWKGTCEAHWEATSHLSLVAGIARSHVDRLRAANVADLEELAALPVGTQIPGIQPDTVSRLVSQARLQSARRKGGESAYEILPLVPGRGFSRLPKPDGGDLFFDMEGDPLFEGGLEYLFGLVDGEGRFTGFWAHDRDAEKKAFEDAVDLLTARLETHPEAHIYHYAAYEETALKRLAMYHGSRETQVDNILRRGKLVDLYQVVRESIRVSEPRYSIKNLEAFYLPAGREGAVKTGGDSIVMYERWRRLGDGKLLDDIRSYNEVDCRSTKLCRDWLVSIRPGSAEWFTSAAAQAADPAKEQARHEAEERTLALTAALLGSAKADEKEWRLLLANLLEFHRREAKPSWWAMFERQGKSEEELIDDAECIGGLRLAANMTPRPDKKSIVYTLTFPAQDFKMRVGDKPVRAGTLEPAGEVVSIDEEARTIELKLGPSRSRFEQHLSLIPEGPVGDKALREAVYRYAEAVARGDAEHYSAITEILRKALPTLEGRDRGMALLDDGVDTVMGAVEAIARLSGSYLLVQGPPGAGKTYTSSHAIVSLLAAGKKVGVASNSHKAINNLLREIETTARDRGLRFKGIKKSSREDQFLGGGQIADTTSNADATPDYQLVAGTAWLFARPEFDRALDFLFVDEAGQVSLANIIAMGVAARNIVLVGDQMQLSQPIQGTHPGGSGVSGLDYLLAGASTVPPDRGVFLPQTRRMHPDLCRFISDAVYDGRLHSEASTLGQRLNVDFAADPVALAPAGLRFVCLEHDGCSQRCQAEAERLARTYRALLGGAWTNQHGEVQKIGLEDILVVSPYNMQVELLKRALPEGARVGTVDKFQGQEAAVVLISMATSSGDDLPRQIEFLYSRNRLNVAVSRARCLAVIFASPRLLEISCSSIAQMELVNGLCWAKVYSDEQAAESAQAA